MTTLRGLLFFAVIQECFYPGNVVAFPAASVKGLFRFFFLLKF